ncbi:MAG: SMP-30/gluconolactonase/LRE family protein [Bacteroidales bacterium]|nr:SMP-30/gluconolactonase/LRE family protein [Bacteroidales bacterium]
MKLTLIIPAGLLVLILASCSKQEYPVTGSIERLSPQLDQIIAPGTLPEILAEGFEWSEGPLWLREQKKLIFSDIPNNSIFEWSEKDGLKLYLKPSGYTGTIARGGETGSNGLLLDKEGKLVLCQHGDRRMARMEAPLDVPEAKFSTLAGAWKGKRFNSPNDAVFSSTGNLYITDPAYGMEFGFKDSLREIDFTGVFLITPGGEVSLLTDQLTAPNGIGFSPDESRLYVANSGGPSGFIWMEYELREDGLLQNEKLFYDARPASDSLRGAPDGLAVRNDGIIFATGPGGVWILTPGGEHLGIIKTGQATSNCTLDAKNRYLYITADMYLLRIRLR